MIEAVLGVTVPIFLIVAVGYVYGRFHADGIDFVNRINLTLFIPPLLFFVLSEKIPADLAWGGIVIGAAIVVIGSGLLAWPVARLLNMPVKALVPTAMMNNCGNLGLPLTLLAFGEAALPLAVVTFVVYVALHFTVGIWLVSGRLDLKLMVRNPIVIATALGFGFYLTGLHAPAMILPGIEMLSQVAIPLMLVALGVRLTEVDLEHWRIGLIGAALAPATGIVCALAAIWLLDLDTVTAGVLLLFGALPPAVMNYLIAERYDASPAEVATIVSFGNIAALAVIPAVLFFIL